MTPADVSRNPCRWAGSDQPRMLRTHERECNTSGCPGCQPCPERHCALCGIEHVTHEGRGADQTCAACIGVVRGDLKLIAELAERLMPEAIHRGVNSEAANLAGPSIDTVDGLEAWGYRRMSGLLGRIPALADDDSQHPLWVLGTWEMAVREHLDQPSEKRITLAEAQGYLDGHLTLLAHDPEFAFDELARDARGCRGHLEDVLHDGEREERGAPCIACGKARLVKSYGKTEDDDKWTCPRCNQWWTETDYRTKVDGVYVQNAPSLTASQIAETYRVTESTVRRWANPQTDRGITKPARVRKRGKDQHGRQLYDVADVLAARDGNTPEVEDAQTAAG